MTIYISGFPFFEENVSNAVMLPTTDENYADLAWVVTQIENVACLCPINLRDGSIEMGQIVLLSELGYIMPQEGELAVVTTHAEQPLLLTIENRSYADGSIVSALEFTYDFETNTLEGDVLNELTEEGESDASEQDD